ncbi:MAG: hypothetical protein ACR2KP_12580 [Egibacteraceae bacterium]
MLTFSDAANLTTAQRQQLWGHAIVHPYALEGYTSQHPRAW